ncbi:MAG TPA: hypothetical protein VJ276_16610 [Thermoanaerobaculia bacterium]|nr:hypothetical protein [Thermoanaerobaculia bacterium]
MKKLLMALALFTASAAGAAEYSDLYIVPIAGHSHGAYGTSWRSDVMLHNIQQVPITVEIAMVENGRSPSAEPVAIGAGTRLSPGETRLLSDVAGALQRDVAGALIVGADMPFAVTSRTWAELPAGRTLGQTVSPVAISGTADAVNDLAVLPSLADSDRQRSNVGVFIAASRAPLVVEITALSPSGTTLGSQSVVVAEPGFIHRQLSLAQIAGAATSATAVVRIVEGDGIVVPYASIIDNASAEAAFVSGEPISAHGKTTLGMLLGVVRVRK